MVSAPPIFAVAHRANRYGNLAFAELPGAAMSLTTVGASIRQIVSFISTAESRHETILRLTIVRTGVLERINFASAWKVPISSMNPEINMRENSSMIVGISMADVHEMYS